MVKKNIVLVSAILFAGVALSVSAQTTTTTSSPKVGGDRDAHGCIPSAGYSWNAERKVCVRQWEKKQNEKNKTESARASSTEARASERTDEQTKRVDEARKEVSKIITHLNAAIDRVQKLSDRTVTRINKVSAEGGDVTASKKYLASAAVKLSEARAKVLTIRTTADAALVPGQAAKDKNIMKKLEVLVRDTTKTIDAAHRLVAQAVSSIKPGLNKPRATSTAATKDR